MRRLGILTGGDAAKRFVTEDFVCPLQVWLARQRSELSVTGLRRLGILAGGDAAKRVVT